MLDRETYNATIIAAKQMFSLMANEMSEETVVGLIDQMRASIRDFLIRMDCDPTDESHLRAFVVGSLFSLQAQMNYTPLGGTAAFVPATAFNMIMFPIYKDVIGIDIIEAVLSKIVENEDSFNEKLLGQVFGFHDGDDDGDEGVSI